MNIVSDLEMLEPSPPIKKIRFPENSCDPPSPTATPLKNPSSSNASSPPKSVDSPNCRNEDSSNSLFV